MTTCNLEQTKNKDKNVNITSKSFKITYIVLKCYSVILQKIFSYDFKRRLVVQNLNMAWSRRFIPKLFIWHSSGDIVRMKWRYYRAGLYTEKKRSHWLKQWPIRKGLGDKKGELSLVEDVIWTSSKRWTGQQIHEFLTHFQKVWTK